MDREDKLRIGITGTRTWENRTKIKTFIFKLKEHTTRPIVIVSLGEKNGADRYAKKYALELGYGYEEVNAPHTPRNLYSVMSESFHDKPYSPKNFYLRNKVFASIVESCVVFDDKVGTDSNLSRIITQLNRAHKKVVTIN